MSLTIISATWANAEETMAVVVTLESGSVLAGPAHNGDIWAAVLSSGINISNAPPTAQDVVGERLRRLSLGFDYDLGDARGVHRIGTTAEDLAGWDEVTKAASALISVGSGSTTFNVVTDTGPVQVTALDWQSVLIAASQHRQPIWAASFAIQAMDPIPADYNADSYWP